MAIFHVDVRAVQRSAGRSATAGAAYVTGTRVVDERTGRVSDYRRRHGVEAVGQVGWHRDVASLWNAAEQAEKHPRGITARTAIIALPTELEGKDRISCLEEISAQIRNRWSVAVTWAAHAPDDEGDERNFHGHLIWTTRTVTDDGFFGAKTRELDVKPSSSQEITWLRSMIAETINHHLADDGLDARIDSRSRRTRWLAGEISEAEATRALHLGPSASALERRGLQTDRGDHNRAVATVRSKARKLREIQNELALDPINQALAAPSMRTSDEHYRSAGWRARVTDAANLLTIPVFFEPLATALAGPASLRPPLSHLSANQPHVAAAAARLGSDWREGSLGSRSTRGDMGRAEQSPPGRPEPGRSALGAPGRAGQGDRAAPKNLHRPGCAAPPRDQNSSRAVRSASAEAAFQAVLARSPHDLPSPDPLEVTFSRAGLGAQKLVHQARETLVSKALKRLKYRLSRWVLRAFDVAAGRAKEPARIPDGLAHAAYKEGLRAGVASPEVLENPEACTRAANRIASHIATAAAASNHSTGNSPTNRPDRISSTAFR